MTLDRDTQTNPRAFLPQGRAPRIAIIVDFLEYSYQMDVVEGARRAAKAEGATLVALAGGSLDASLPDASLRNRLFEFVSETRFDGLVIMTGTLGGVSGEQVLSKICPKMPQERVCFVAYPVVGSPSVLIDNRSGMRRLVEHLVTEHGYRKIAFVRGPHANPEAEERFRAYLDVLEMNDIPVDDHLVFEGEFRERTGERAICAFFDERGISPENLDAVIAADDLIAIGVTRELRKRGLSIPSDVAVCGFDDIEEARYAAPPLTTVRQPLHEQGARAVRLVLSALRGEGDPQPHVLETVNVYRRSCGCTAEDSGFITERPVGETDVSMVDRLERRRELIVSELAEFGGVDFSELGPDWEGRMFDSLDAVLRGQPTAFRREFDLLLEGLVVSGGDIGAVNGIISSLRRHLSFCAGDDAGNIRTYEAVLHDARLLTTDAVERAQARKRLALEQTSRVLSDVSARLASAHRRVRLDDLIFAQLPRIGIRTCFVSRYAQDQIGRAELVVAFGPAGKVEPKDGRRRFESADLVPPGVIPLWEGRQLVVEPLFHKGLPLGFAVFGLGEVEGYVHEILQKMLSLALYQTSEAS